ncbi:aspartate-rich protein 1-like isoform X2 [Macaca thibetana thibetana]|uniref:aspartate-rich protein 1-like isoform X2 n=1 Tax=Macaca thibetana thibetana TaxID=257877 RepID=UPI0021BC7203|nr:aspartate-rich protein 1-like isoform X2 [Macaca thibetana thibetana]
MGNILTCCVCPKVSSNCGWHRGKVASSYESDIYEAVAATKSASTTVEPGKLDVGATEGHDLQHISNQKMPTAPVPDLAECDLDIVEEMLPEMMDYTAQNSNCSPEDSLSLKSLPPSEEDNDDAQILPSHVQASPEDNLSFVSLSRNEDYDGSDDDDDDDDDDDAQILPSRVQASPEDNPSLVSLLRSEDGDCDDDDDEDDDDTQILPSRVQGSSEYNLSLVSPPPSEDYDCDDNEDDDDVQILPSRVQAWPEDRLFLRCSPRYKDEDDDDDADCDDDCDDDDDVHITAWKENDLTLESISDEETYPGRELHARKNPMGKGSQEPQVIPADCEEGLKEGV